MHGFKKKLLDNNPENSKKEESPESGLLKHAADSKSQIDPIANPSHIPLSKKLEELRRSFQEELDRDVNAKQNPSLRENSDLAASIETLERRFEELKSTLMHELREARSNSDSGERVQRIEKRLDILMRMFEAELSEKYEPQVTAEDFQRLEKRINILKKMFDTQFSRKGESPAAQKEISELEQKFNELQETFQSGTLGISLDSLASDIIKLDNAIGLIQEKFLKDLNSRLNEKASLADLAQLDEQVRELRQIVGQSARGVDNRELRAITSDVERFQQDVSSEVMRIEKNLSDLRRSFQTELSNNTDARFLSRDLSALKSQVDILSRSVSGDSQTDVKALQRHVRDMEDRFDTFRREVRDQLSAAKGSAEAQETLKRFEIRFEALREEIRGDADNAGNPAFLAAHIKKLETDLEDLRTIMHSELASRDSRRKEGFADTGSFKAFEEQLADFKDTVIFELAKKSDADSVKTAIENIENEFNEIRAKVQIALEHSADSKKLAADIEELQTCLEDIKNNENPDYLSEDLQPFARGLDTLRHDFEAERVRLSQLESAQSDTVRMIEGIRAFQEQYESFRSRIQSELDGKGSSVEYLALINDVSDGLRKVNERVERLDAGYVEALYLQDRMGELQKSMEEFQSQLAVISDASVSDEVKKSLDEIKTQIKEVSEDAAAGKELVQDVRAAENEISRLKEGYDKISQVDEDYRTVCEDIEKIERDLRRIEEAGRSASTDEIRALKDQFDFLQQDFRREFEQLTETRVVFREIPRLEQALEEFKERTQYELKQKVAYDEFRDHIQSLEQRLGSALNDFENQPGMYLERQEALSRFQQVSDEVKSLRSQFDAEYRKVSETQASARDIQDFQLKLIQLSDKVAKLDPEKFYTKVDSEIKGLRKSLETETESLTQKFKKLAASLKPRPAFFYTGVGVLALLIAAAGLGVGVQWMKSKMVPAWEKEMAHMQDVSSMKLDRYLTSDRMQSLIDETARMHTQDQINGTFKRSIEVFVDVISKKVDALVAQMEADSQAASQRLQDITDFSAIAAAAINGDRNAFDRLAEIAGNNSHPFSGAANAAIENVFAAISSLNESTALSRAGHERVVYKKLSHFEKAYNDAPAAYHPAMLLDLWTSERIDRQEKIDFLMERIASDESLLVVARACELIDETAGLYKPFTEYHAYLQWWNEKKFNDNAYAL